MRRVLLLVVAWSLVLAGCQYGADSVAAERGDDMVTLDDVTNGLINHASQGHDSAGDPAANQLAGAFYADDGVVRSREKNYFSEGKGGTTAPNAPARPERMLVQRGEIAVEVARPEEAARTFVAKVGEWGGYLQNQNGARVTVRLPAKHFNDAFAAARELGRVLRESRAADDVTEEFVDLGIRLDTARKSRERLLEVLQKAEKVEDILKVEAELRRLTEEIERMEGRRKFLADQVTMATLTVQFDSTKEPPPPPKRREKSQFGWIQRVGAESMMGGY